MSTGPGKIKMLLMMVTFSLCYRLSESVHKNIVDFDDSDMERLFQQWEENDDKEEDVIPDRDNAELNNIMQDGKIDPQHLLKQSKKGKPVMIFVGVHGDKPDQAYTEQVSTRWMQSLQNAQIQVQRYVVAPDRVLLMVEDGSLAWDVKDYLTKLTECTTVSFDQLSFDCKDKKEEL